MTSITRRKSSAASDPILARWVMPAALTRPSIRARSPGELAPASGIRDVEDAIGARRDINAHHGRAPLAQETGGRATDAAQLRPSR